MDQDSFRKLLATPAAPGAPSKTAPARPAKPTTGAGQPAFKPRKVQKHDAAYRDRAAERRAGAAGDFAEAEALLEVFERQHAADADRQAVDAQRAYLGGDSAHSVLVKGLDFALLEQNRARAASTGGAADDDSLEEAFREARPPEKEKKEKRSRAELVAELKARRGDAPALAAPAEPAAGEKAADIEAAKKAGKFKPIGFKPVAPPKAKRTAEGKSGDNGMRKKKKRKIADATDKSTVIGKSQGETVENLSNGMAGPSGSTTVAAQPASREPKSVPEDDPAEVDIFADAGEYEGIKFDDDDNDETAGAAPPPDTDAPSPPAPPREWFADAEENDAPATTTPAEQREPAPHPEREPEPEPEPEQPVRLAALASSALPSIADVLAADSALEAAEKRRARKEKRKGGGGGGGGGKGEGEGKKKNAETKLNRDYQKLKAYTDKKAGAS